MAKRALCVGINDYPDMDSDLNGCVNDARAWASLLTEQFDFPATDVRVMTDVEATKQGIMSGLKSLLKGARDGDVLVFTNSSHGSYLLDRDGDESTYDQVICPHDIAANVILDDELRELFSAIPSGVHLVALLDNCHSGGATREEDRKPRFLDPAKRGDPTIADELTGLPPAGIERYPESGMRELLLSGCMANQVAWDAKLGGRFHGAMSYHALKAIQDAGYALTYRELHMRVISLLDKAKFNQDPQLQGTDANKERRVFV